MLHDRIQGLKESGYDLRGIYLELSKENPDIDYEMVVGLYASPLSTEVGMTDKLRVFSKEKFLADPAGGYRELEYGAYYGTSATLKLMVDRADSGIAHCDMTTREIVALNRDMAATLQVLNTLRRLESNQSTQNISLATFVSEIDED